MEYTINNKKYNVIIEKKHNKNTYIKITDDLNILVTTNFFNSEKNIKKMLDENNKFLIKAIESQEKRNEKNLGFSFLGKKYDIIILPTIKDVEIDNNKIYVKDMETLSKWLKKQMNKVFLERLDYNYSLFNEKIPYPKMRIRNMKTRWGVCNRKDNIVTLNSNLIKEGIEKIDYVIIHELSHFIHFNHSALFWQVVSKYCHDYKRIRKELRG